MSQHDTTPPWPNPYLPHLNAEARTFANRLRLTDMEGDAFDQIAELRCAIKERSWAEARAAYAEIGRQIQLMESGNG